MPAPKSFKEAAELLDWMLHHSYCQGRLIETGQQAAAAEEQRLAFEDQNGILRLLKKFLLS